MAQEQRQRRGVNHSVGFTIKRFDLKEMCGITHNTGNIKADKQFVDKTQYI